MTDYGFWRKTNLIRQTYKINGEKAIHLKPRPQSKDARPSTKAKFGASCEACARYLQDVPNRFCSIACKVTRINFIVSASFYCFMFLLFQQYFHSNRRTGTLLAQDRKEIPLTVISDCIFRFQLFQWSLKIKAMKSSPYQFRNLPTFPGRKTPMQKSIQVRTNRHFPWLICLRILKAGWIQLWNQEDNCTREKASLGGRHYVSQNNNHVLFFFFFPRFYIYIYIYDTFMVHIKVLNNNNNNPQIAFKNISLLGGPHSEIKGGLVEMESPQQEKNHSRLYSLFVCVVFRNK